MSEPKKEHRYPPYEHNFDDLCDAGCTRVVPRRFSDNELRTKGWDVADDPSFVDGKRRICAACVDDTKTPRCESCNELATRTTADDVDVCEACYREIP
jgi:hypothetical protein